MAFVTKVYNLNFFSRSYWTGLHQKLAEMNKLRLFQRGNTVKIMTIMVALRQLCGRDSSGEADERQPAAGGEGEGSAECE